MPALALLHFDMPHTWAEIGSGTGWTGKASRPPGTVKQRTRTKAKAGTKPKTDTSLVEGSMAAFDTGDTEPVLADPAAIPPDVILEDAHRRSILLSTAEKVTFLLDTVGPRVTAAALGLFDARPLRRWSTGELEPRSEIVEDRLRILYHVVYAVAQAYGPAAASGFLRSANPHLNDDAILLLLRGDDVRDQERKIIAATRSFLGE